jgi:hypothetical protein
MLDQIMRKFATLERALGPNEEMGRVMVGQTEAVREMRPLLDSLRAMLAASPPPAEGWRNEEAERFQDSKFKFENGRVINRWSGEAVPQDEPVMVFRARDVHALRAISAYMDFLADPHHREVVMSRYIQFERFALDHPDRMKEPVSAMHPDPSAGGVSAAATSPAQPSGMNPPGPFRRVRGHDLWRGRFRRAE